MVRESCLDGVFILPVNNYATQLCYVCAEKYREFYKNKPVEPLKVSAESFILKECLLFLLPTV